MIALNTSEATARTRPLAFGAHAWIDIAAIVLIVGATIVWSFISGKDLNWDQLNYHFYVGYAFLNDRLGHDFMAANSQSSLNPLAYVPFAWMVAHHWHSLLIASVLAAFHSLNIVFAYFITSITLRDVEHRRLLASLAAVLAFFSPIFLMEAGTTFADITTSALVLGAVLLLVRTDFGNSGWSYGLVAAGLLFGLASGLKLSNFVFAPAFAVMLICIAARYKQLLLGGILFCLGSFAGLVATHGYWSWKLSLNPERRVTGPTSSAILPQRFLPESWLEAATLPFRMAELRSWVYVESIAPDLRFAAALLATAGAAIVIVRARSFPPGLGSGAGRRALGLVAFFLSALVLWTLTSANGRYGLTAAIVCGPALVVLVHVALQGRKRPVTAVLACLALAQIGHASNVTLRWEGGPWTTSWYDASVPERLKSEPHLYVTIGNNSASYIASSLYAGSAFTNPIGQVSIELDGPGGEQLLELFSRYSGRIRMLAQAPLVEDDIAVSHWIRSGNAIIARLGYAIDETDCLVISTAGPPWQKGRDFDSSSARALTRYRTCKLMERPYTRADERRRIQRVADNIVNWCPKIFLSSPNSVEETPDGWFANFVSNDSTLIFKGDRILLTQPHTAGDIDLGTLDEWESGIRPDCEAIPARLRNVLTFD